MATDLAESLRRQFVDYNYQWKVNGELVTPTAEDLDQTIDRAKEVLYTEPVPSQMEVGRLIIRHRRPGKFEVYLHIGDSND